MQIVIDISEEDYRRIQDIPNVFDSLTSRTYLAIRNGTPLPKGHGRLIDADDIDNIMVVHNSKDVLIRLEAPAILEATKEKEEN